MKYEQSKYADKKQGDVDKEDREAAKPISWRSTI